MPLPQQTPSSTPQTTPSVSSPPPLPQSPYKLILFVALVVILAVILLADYFYFQKKAPIQKKTIAPPSTQTEQQVPDKCFILGNLFAKGDNPQNECQICDPSIVATGWADKTNGTACQNKEGVCSNGQCVPKVKAVQGGKGGEKSSPPSLP